MLRLWGLGCPLEFLPQAGPRATWQAGLSYLWGLSQRNLGISYTLFVTEDKIGPQLKMTKERCVGLMLMDAMALNPLRQWLYRDLAAAGKPCAQGRPQLR